MCMTLEKLSREEDNDILNTTGRFLLKYAKYREFLMKRGRLFYHFIILLVLLFRFLLFLGTFVNKFCVHVFF